MVIVPVVIKYIEYFSPTRRSVSLVKQIDNSNLSSEKKCAVYKENSPFILIRIAAEMIEPMSSDA